MSQEVNSSSSSSSKGSDAEADHAEGTSDREKQDKQFQDKQEESILLEAKRLVAYPAAKKRKLQLKETNRSRASFVDGAESGGTNDHSVQVQDTVLYVKPNKALPFRGVVHHQDPR
jgi:hypothetical protein